MVLGTSTAQYKFLQVLSATYLWKFYGLQSAACLSSPEEPYDCTDLYNSYAGLGYPPTLPTKTSLYSASNGPDNFYYSDHVTVQYNGLNVTTFPLLSATLINDTVSVLYAACAANSTCTASYNSTGSVNADPVIRALATTNVNTITALLKANPKLYYFPNDHRTVDFFGQIYSRLYGPGENIYSVPGSVVYGLTMGTINATTYLEQLKLGVMLTGGSSEYEALIHTAALGSYAYYRTPSIQSNINLTAPQVFKHVTDGSVDTKRQVTGRAPRSTKPIKQAFSRSPNVCVPGDVQAGLDFTAAVDLACRTQANYLALPLSPQAPMSPLISSNATLGLPVGYNATSFSDVLLGRIAQLCGAGSFGMPCYPGANVWSFNSTVASVISLYKDIQANSAVIGGNAIGSTNLYCAAAVPAYNYFTATQSCCPLDCNSPSCQSTFDDLVPGTGIC